MVMLFAFALAVISALLQGCGESTTTSSSSSSSGSGSGSGGTDNSGTYTSAPTTTTIITTTLAPIDDGQTRVCTYTLNFYDSANQLVSLNFDVVTDDAYIDECQVCCTAISSNTDDSLAFCDSTDTTVMSAGAAYTACQSCPVVEALIQANGLSDADACTICSPGTWNTYGRQGSSAVGSFCQECDEGRYAPQSGTTSCQYCPPGTYNNETGESSIEACIRCSPGTFSDVLGSGTPDDCTQCAEGYYSSEYGATICHYCDAGTWSSEIGATSQAACEECSPGTWSDTLGAISISTCVPCQAGTWSGASGAQSSSTCSACIAGTWSDTEGASSSEACQDCEPGEWSSIVGSTSASNCTKCIAGTWSDAAGASDISTCLACTAGTWSSTAGASSSDACQNCKPGEWSSNLGATSASTCIKCIPGTWSGAYGATLESDCQRCEPGYFSDLEGATTIEACEGCIPGTWSSTTGASTEDECIDCAAGKWSGTVGASSASTCIDCSIGTYSTLEGAANLTDCLDCPGGYFTNVLGSTDCNACNVGQYSTGGAAGCSDCGAGTYQESFGMTKCDLCPPGSASDKVGLSSSSGCGTCQAGTFAAVAASTTCTLCPSGSYSAAVGATFCLACEDGSSTPEGSLACCPVQGDEWPSDETLLLAMPPGRRWAYVHHLSGSCDEVGGAERVPALGVATSPMMLGSNVYLATLHQENIYGCVALSCAPAQCGILLPESDEVMPGVPLTVAAYVPTFGSDTLVQCPDSVVFEYAAFGCEPDTIMVFLVVLVAVVSFTIVLGLIFDFILRRRVDFFVEATLRVNWSPKIPGATLEKPPTLAEYRADIVEALKKKCQIPFKLKKLHAWCTDEDSNLCRRKENLISFLELRLKAPRALGLAGATQLRQFLLQHNWSPGNQWAGQTVSVECQTPMLVREIARLPGADIFDHFEHQLERCEQALMKDKAMLQDDAQDRLEGSRKILEQLLTAQCFKAVALQFCLNLVMVIILPSIAVTNMTCEGGYPTLLNFVWFGYVVVSSLGFMSMYIGRLRGDAHVRLLLRNRLRIFLRYLACLTGITDIYQDATFPVIAGICGFDLWWVALWSIFLGVGLMQVSVHVYLVYKAYRKHTRARTPEERDRYSIEALYLALRATDNHVLVYLIKPAVEERLGGGSSWALKSIEARVAFLRFVFEDAEQAALQVNFLFFFDNASIKDKIWIGLSTATSVFHSFALCVQTLPEVRDWLWNRVLLIFPYCSNNFEARFIWLFFLIVIYRALSIFPWLGACTPAGSSTDSTFERLFLIRGLVDHRWPPSYVFTETLVGSGIALGASLVIIVIAAVIWRKSLRLPRTLGLCCLRRGKHLEATQVEDTSTEKRDLNKVLETTAKMGVKNQNDDDLWLAPIRQLHHVALGQKHALAQELLDSIDSAVATVAHSNKIWKPGKFEEQRRSILNEVDRMTQMDVFSGKPPAHVGVDVGKDPPLPSGISSPTGSVVGGIIPDSPSADAASASDLRVATLPDGCLDNFRKQVELSLDLAEVRSNILRLLSEKTFRKSTLSEKAANIQTATKGLAPLKLLHWSVISQLGRLPKYNSECGSCEEVEVAIARTISKTYGNVDHSEILAAAQQKCREADKHAPPRSAFAKKEANMLPSTRLRLNAQRRIVLVYVSHVWLRYPRSPDSETNVKAKTLVHFARWLTSQAKARYLDIEVFFWVDYSCMDGFGEAGVVALPLFIAACTHVLTWSTPDFDRRAWTMLERLMAYSFCAGGMLPYAVNEDSFPLADSHEGDKKGSKVDLKPSVVGKKSSADSAPWKIAPLDFTTNVLQTTVVRRPKRLPDPLDSEVCRPLMPEAPSSQRRQMSQLVATALAVPALEVFSDRQPVDFGRTEVVEQLLGIYRPVNEGEKVDDHPRVDHWLQLDERAGGAPSIQWRIILEQPGVHQPCRLGDDEEELRLRVGLETEALPTAMPNEVKELYAAMDKAWEERQTSGVTENVEKAAIALATALRGNAQAALKANLEPELRSALEQLKGVVDIPEEPLLRRHFTKAQLTSAIKANSLYELQMAIRYARCQEEVEVGVPFPELELALEKEKELQIQELRRQASATLHEPDATIAAIFATIEVARSSEWDDIEQSGVEVLQDRLRKAKFTDPGVTARILHHSKKMGLTTLASEAEHLLDLETEKAVENAATAKSAQDLLALDAAIRDHCTGTMVLKALLEYIDQQHAASITIAHGIEAREEAVKALGMIKDDQSSRKEVKKKAQDAWDDQRVTIKAKRDDAHALVRRGPLSALQARTEAKLWGWTEVERAGKTAIEVEATQIMQKTSEKHSEGAACIAELGPIYNAAHEGSFDDTVEKLEQVFDHVLTVTKNAGEAIILFKMLTEAENQKCLKFAGDCQAALQTLLPTLPIKDLERLKTTAADANRPDVVKMAEEAREMAQKALEAKKDEARKSLEETEDLEVLALSVGELTAQGWTEVRDEASKRFGKVLKSAMESADGKMLPKVAIAYNVAKEKKVHECAQMAEKQLRRYFEGNRDKGNVSCVYRLRHALVSEVDSHKDMKLFQAASTYMNEIVKTAAKAESHMVLVDMLTELKSVAVEMNDDLVLFDVEALLKVQKKVKELKQTSKNHKGWMEVIKDARFPSSGQEFVGMLREAKYELQKLFDMWKEKGHAKPLEDLAKETHCGVATLAEMAESAQKIMKSKAIMDQATDTSDPKLLCRTVVEFRKEGATAWARQLLETLKKRVAAAESESDLDQKALRLEALHVAAAEASLDDILKLVLSAVGGFLPKGWAAASDVTTGSFMLRKVEAKDDKLIKRIQELVDATFKGWGHCQVTRDRRNPLFTALKVEQVVHIENAKNYMSFWSKRAQVVKEFKELSVADQVTDWDIKSRQVSMEGFEGDTPIDPSVNEAWLWHGTSPAGASGITDTDFDMGRAGSAAGSMFGRGLYFAESCMKADEYTVSDGQDRCPMLLCRVILGRLKYCDAEFPFDVSEQLEDACDRNKGGNHHAVLGDRQKVRGTFREFIIFDNCQVYPEYLVWYSRVPPLVQKR